MKQQSDAIISTGIEESVLSLRPRRTLRDFCAFDENAQIVNFAQSVLGRSILLLIFVSAFMLLKGNWKIPIALVLAAGAYSYLPRYRTVLLATATFSVLLFIGPFWYGGQDAIYHIMKLEEVTQLSARKIAFIALFVFFAFALVSLELAKRYKTMFFARRPVVTSFVIILVLCITATSDTLQGLPQVMLWAFIIVFSAYIWFLNYALVDQRSRRRSSHLFQLGIFHPFWGSSSTPLGKGAAFLRKTMAKTPEELAVTQLKGLKLLLWAIILQALKRLLSWQIEVEWGIPRLAEVQAMHANNQTYSIFIGWTSLVWATARSALSLAIWGHQIIAVARLSGFRLPRNTYRPLESRTLIEFWNRYYYYFKELLVEFFFMPTFFRVFRNHPRLRVFFATFMAAGVGNAMYHFVSDIKYVLIKGPWWALSTFESYLFYCFVLATGIGISQIRAESGITPSNTLLGRLWSFLCVWTFVVCLYVFGNETRTYTLNERLSFMANLFGIN